MFLQSLQQLDSLLPMRQTSRLLYRSFTRCLQTTALARASPQRWHLPLAQRYSSASLSRSYIVRIPGQVYYCRRSCTYAGAAQRTGTPSRTVAELNAFRASFLILVAICGFWIVSVGAVIFSIQAFDTGEQKSEMVANGTVYVAGFLLVLVVNAAIIAPALMLLRPLRLARTMSRERRARTPRQEFRGEHKPFS